jgi:uncharacterized protein
MQKLLWRVSTILIAISFVYDCCAQDKTIDSSNSQLKSLLQFVIRDNNSKITGWTIDYGKLFTIEQKKVLDSIAGEFESKTGIEICIFTLDTTMTTKDNFDNFVLNLHNTLAVGKKTKDNGIVIGISRALRKIRVSNGDGIAKILTDTN